MKALKKIFDINKISTLFFYSSIVAFIISFNFAHNQSGGWTQQFLPDLDGKPLKDITFTDSLTGYALIGYSNDDSNYILKTTNSGDNWSVSRFETNRINKISFLNSDTGFACGSDGLNAYMIKTTNGGFNWNTMNTSSTGWNITEMFVLNVDSIWTCESELYFYLRRTTNGGITWTNQFDQTSQLKKVYMYNGRIGFMCESSKLFKTTNSGNNWNHIPGANGFRDIYFIDSLNGWKANQIINDSSFKKTKDGGINWYSQRMPSGGYISSSSGINEFSNINKDTIWGSGGLLRFPNNSLRGILYFSSNGGNNWIYQIPDTNFKIPNFLSIIFIEKFFGWGYSTFLNQTGSIVSQGIHTKVGGDTTFITSVNQVLNKIPNNFNLYQNFPNPFNPKTTISYNLDKRSFVEIKIYNILGKEIVTLVNQSQNSGFYKIEFNSKEELTVAELNSGIYFYSLILDGNLVDTKKMILLK